MEKIAREIKRLEPVVEELKKFEDPDDRLDLIERQEIVTEFLSEPGPIKTFLQGLAPECALAIKSVIFLGQGDSVFRMPDTTEPPFDQLRVLLQKLLQTEHFYHDMGGIVGYHLTVLKLIAARQTPSTESAKQASLMEPPGTDLSHLSLEVREAIIEGIRLLPELGELYPVGGAGDRLGLVSESSGESLPAARLDFLGRSLITGLIRDLQAREYLYFKLFSKQICTPVAMMTSHEKHNHLHIQKILDEDAWYGRPKESFTLFTQPMTPVINEEGNWAVRGPLNPCLKPGGHGVIWKLAKDEKVFERFLEQGRRSFLLRQVNNPVAGVGHGLLAFTGIGLKDRKAFGFASCPRRVHSAEGMDVLKLQDGKYCLTNVEYTDFAQWGVEDEPRNEGDEYSRFPSNTNILFADITTVSDLVEQHPLPGQLINMKNRFPYRDPDGTERQVHADRLESSMQNIADYISAPSIDELPSFLTYNHRNETISVTKRSYKEGAEIWETPVGCLYEILANNQALLRLHCGMDVPDFSDTDSYLSEGPNLFFLYHPALGPVYSIIGQKLRDGRIAAGSELQLELAELDMENLQLDGSLYIHATDCLGKRDENGLIHYSDQSGKCTLKNVTVVNDGIDRMETRDWWKNRPVRTESLRITLKGNSEFFAENVTFKGHHTITVKDGTRVMAYEENGELLFKEEPIDQATWSWRYTINQDKEIQLTRRDLRDRARSTNGQPSQLAS